MTVPKSENNPAQTPDQLVNPAIDAATELSEQELNAVSGGTGVFEIQQDVTVNKAKTADKAYSAMDGYIRG